MEVIKLVSLSVCHVFLASQLHHVPFCQKLTRPFFVQGLWKPLVSAIITGYKTLSSEGGYVGTLGPLGVVLPVILLCVCVHLFLKWSLQLNLPEVFIGACEANRIGKTFSPQGQEKLLKAAGVFWVQLLGTILSVLECFSSSPTSNWSSPKRTGCIMFTPDFKKKTVCFIGGASF